MTSIELLERAAGSLGLATVRDGTALRVTVFPHIALLFANEKGQTTTKRCYGAFWWVFTLGSVAVSSMAMFNFATTPTFNRWTAAWALLFWWVFWNQVRDGARVERTRERLLDRAYDMGKSA